VRRADHPAEQSSPNVEEDPMSGGVYKFIDLVGTSSKSIEDAVNGAVSHAAKTVHEIRWFEIKDVRGRVEKNAVVEYQVGVRLGFKLD
jgi:flavin-binding protein dodecin